VSGILLHRSLSDCPQVSRFLLLFTIVRALYSGVTTVRVSYCIPRLGSVTVYHG
jgi:hypothetical protein